MIDRKILWNHFKNFASVKRIWCYKYKVEHFSSKEWVFYHMIKDLDDLPPEHQDLLELSEMLWEANDTNTTRILELAVNLVQNNQLTIFNVLAMIDYICSKRIKQLNFYENLYSGVIAALNYQIKTKLRFESKYLQALLVLRRKINFYAPSEFENSTEQEILDIYPQGTLSHIIFWDKFDDLQTMITNTVDFNNQMMINKESLLDFSSRCGAINCFKFFVNSGCKITKKTFKNSFIGNCYEIIHICERSVEITDWCIRLAVNNHHNEVVEYLVEKYGMTFTWMSPLNSFNFKCFYEKLIGATNIDEIDATGHSALMAATTCEFASICNLLLDMNANIELPDYNGNTALFLAMMNNHPHIG